MSVMRRDRSSCQNKGGVYQKVKEHFLLKERGTCQRKGALVKVKKGHFGGYLKKLGWHCAPPPLPPGIPHLHVCVCVYHRDIYLILSIYLYGVHT